MNNHKMLASKDESARKLPARPFQIVTLLDMQPFIAPLFFLAISGIESQICKIKSAIKERSPNSRLTQGEYLELTHELKFLDKEAEGLGFRRVTRRIMEFDFSMLDERVLPSLSIILHDLKSLQQAIRHDLDARTFMFLRPDDREYYDKQQLFGPEVFNSFPSARHDVAEAGNCYATGRYTAAVFHCMCVAEKGLHALAFDLNRRFGANISFGSKPIRYVNWGNILQKIDTEIRILLDPNRKPRLTQDDLKFYSSAAKEFVYIKILWRDDVSHSRLEADEPIAKSVIDHVKAFMIYLSKQGLTEEIT